MDELSTIKKRVALLMHHLCDPVIVMGMAQCGTSLLAEMVHRGGTPMFTGNEDPSYDDGLKYERPLCKAINRRLLGVPRDSKGPHSILPLWTWTLQPFPREELTLLKKEVGGSAWGFKDPRTTHTYEMWLEVFPEGARLYSYRGHREYLRRCLRIKRKIRIRRARQEMNAWLAYNEAIVRNCERDQADGRPWALLFYDELMQDPQLIRRAEEVTGIPLFDARNPDLRRTEPAKSLNSLPLRDRFYVFCAEFGKHSRLRRLYARLDSLRLSTAK
jgi:hypothetical protein